MSPASHLVRWLVLGFCCTSAEAEFVNFAATDAKPGLVSDTSLRVERTIAVGDPQGDNSSGGVGNKVVTKFFWIPDDPPKPEPRLLVMHAQGFFRLYNNGVKGTGYVDAGNAKVIDISIDVQWQGLHSLGFDPQWPAQPYVYILYTGFTFIDQAAGQSYPNTLNYYRPIWRDNCQGTEKRDNYNTCFAASFCSAQNIAANNCDATRWYCEIMGHIDRVQVDPETFEQVGPRVNIYKGGCSGYWGHVYGNILFDKQTNMIFMFGDKAIDWVKVDHGCSAADMCFDTAAGEPQGQWNSQRDHADHGKVMKTANYRTAMTPMVKGVDFTVLARGVRNPFSASWDTDGSNDILIGDVGDVDGERVHKFSTAGAPNPEYNMGWPCVDSIRDYEKGVNPLVINTEGETQRADWLAAMGLGACDQVYKAVGGDALTKVVLGDTIPADVGFRPPLFEYRFPANLDPLYDGCSDSNAAITGVIRNSYGAVGPYYKGGMFISDYPKRCVFHIPQLADGTLDWDHPRAILENLGASFMDLHPITKELMILDYDGLNIIRVSGSTVPSTGTTLDVAVAVITPPPDGAQVTNITQSCPQSPTQLEWTATTEVGADGTTENIVYTGTLDIGAIQYTNKFGETRTRGFNGGLPGPTIIMEPCKVYKLTYTNSMTGWPNPKLDIINGKKDPCTTNLHVHGLHLAGMGGADNVLTIEIDPGGSYTYTYAIPCDHAGGTFFYHPHHHGSVSLQLGGGATGMLIIADNMSLEGLSEPAFFKNMPEIHLVIQKINAAASLPTATISGDELFETTATQKHILINGCTDYTTDIVANTWTKIRMAFVGTAYPAVMEILPPAGSAACKARLLAKDGVYLSTVPRVLDDPRFFFSVGSRVDVAIYCTEPGAHVINMDQIRGGETLAQTNVGTLNVISSPTGAADPDELEAWVPCRPFYLQDLVSMDATLAGPVQLSLDFINAAISGKIFLGIDNPASVIATIEEGQFYGWSFVGTDQHPAHMHINHVQLQTFTQWEEMPDWSAPGDWIDTISFEGQVTVRFRADRFGGLALVHCHVSDHSDSGMALLVNITGGLGTDDFSTSVIKPVQCVVALPASGASDVPTSSPEVGANTDTTTTAAGSATGGASNRLSVSSALIVVYAMTIVAVVCSSMY